jgi:hypothetical protein
MVFRSRGTNTITCISTVTANTRTCIKTIMKPNISSNFMSTSVPNIVHLAYDGTSLTRTPQPEITFSLLGFEHLPFSLTDAARREQREASSARAQSAHQSAKSDACSSAMAARSFCRRT